MIAKTYIVANLRSLDTLYQRSSSVRNGLFYSKLATIELCGWIEISMDDLVKRCATRNLAVAKNRIEIDSIIKRTYGFDYESHFRKMLVQVIGLKQVERVEAKVDPLKFQLLQAALAALKASRNSLAHTYLKGATVTLDAPSVTKARFPAVYDGLKALEETLAELAL